jgi:hypothetical protein
MRADEPYVDDAVGIVDPHKDTILVAGDIEYDSAVFENAGGADIPFNICRHGPVGSSDLPIPCHYWIPRVGIRPTSVEEGLERSERNDPHAGIHSMVPNWDQEILATWAGRR